MRHYARSYSRKQNNNAAKNYVFAEIPVVAKAFERIFDSLENLGFLGNVNCRDDLHGIGPKQTHAVEELDRGREVVVR